MEQRDMGDAGLLEAVLFAAGDPLGRDALAHVMDCPADAIEPLVEKLRQELLARGSGLTVHRVAGGYQLVTRQEAYPVVERLSQVTERRLSAPTLETLSIIAFKQPITKPEIERLRGVRIERALAKLLELDLIEERGRKQVIGRPILYGTTAAFLRCFGLESLSDLPQLPTTEDAAESLDEEQKAILRESLARRQPQEAPAAGVAGDTEAAPTAEAVPREDAEPGAAEAKDAAASKTQAEQQKD